MTEKGGVQSVERIFQLIEQLASHPAGASLQRLAQETGLAKSTAHRLLASLVSLGYAAQEPETGRCFGPDSIAPYCRSHNGVLLANHGALTWGKDPEQAYMRMESLEYYATVSMYTGHIIGQANELTCEQVDRLVDTRTRLGIQSGGRPVCRHAEAGEPRPCECGLCNLTPAALSELICHLIATLPEDVTRLLRHSS